MSRCLTTSRDAKTHNAKPSIHAGGGGSVVVGCSPFDKRLCGVVDVPDLRCGVYPGQVYFRVGKVRATFVGRPGIQYVVSQARLFVRRTTAHRPPLNGKKNLSRTSAMGTGRPALS